MTTERKVIIAGGRHYEFTGADLEFLDQLHTESPITEVVCGCATGADTCGRLWASLNTVPVATFRPDWRKHGKAAGPMRNAEMAEYADEVVLFPGGRGTESMRSQAKKHGLVIHDRTGSEQ